MFQIEDHQHGSPQAGRFSSLFSEFLMQLCAFVFLEDISGELPPYEETCLSVPMDPLMMAAYRENESYCAGTGSCEADVLADGIGETN